MGIHGEAVVVGFGGDAQAVRLDAPLESVIGVVGGNAMHVSFAGDATAVILRGGSPSGVGSGGDFAGYGGGYRMIGGGERTTNAVDGGHGHGGENGGIYAVADGGGLAEDGGATVVYNRGGSGAL